MLSLRTEGIAMLQAEGCDGLDNSGAKRKGEDNGGKTKRVEEDNKKEVTRRRKAKLSPG